MSCWCMAPVVPAAASPPRSWQLSEKFHGPLEVADDSFSGLVVAERGGPGRVSCPTSLVVKHGTPSLRRQSGLW
jgi:hypothetical protein